jgi:hypothetical protein
VVWEDGGREAPSYPILSFVALNERLVRFDGRLVELDEGAKGSTRGSKGRTRP